MAVRRSGINGGGLGEQQRENRATEIPFRFVHPLKRRHPKLECEKMHIGTCPQNCGAASLPLAVANTRLHGECTME